jgi:hypothetical protein
MDSDVGICERCRIWKKPSRWPGLLLLEIVNMKPGLLREREE